ncbi:MAG: hypothetical protein Ct9H300mP12_17820 [Acidimicrobiales bacterium]|nr:MAG: hypothetical protein Ct9H300mP12_17820 [Acidimicrobiales bacterium]
MSTVRPSPGVVPPTEPAPVERLATVHRLVTDVLAAEPAVVGAVRRQKGRSEPGLP